ncbi:MAG: UxaA family hydrolase, partial [Bacteroidales bacterium]|nr:UxaA family hydrolase [Bacteroidales bacterium]
MKYIRINPADNVAVALQDLSRGEVVEGVSLRSDVPRGHKVLLRDLRAGENVIKYGFPIGHVTADTPAGSLVDHGNLKTNLEGLQEYRYEPEISPLASLGRNDKASFVISSEVEKSITFKGFRRSDGRVGIRNQIWVIPTVGCVNGVCQQIVERFNAELC